MKTKQTVTHPTQYCCISKRKIVKPALITPINCNQHVTLNELKVIFERLQFHVHIESKLFDAVKAIF